MNISASRNYRLIYYVLLYYIKNKYQFISLFVYVCYMPQFYYGGINVWVLEKRFEFGLNFDN